MSLSQGDPEGEILGVQTELEDLQESEEESRWEKLNTIVAALWYKGKAVLTGTILKQVLLLLPHPICPPARCCVVTQFQR